MFGGAVGNVWDRLFRGTVTDFVQVFFGSYEFPFVQRGRFRDYCGRRTAADRFVANQALSNIPNTLSRSPAVSRISPKTLFKTAFCESYCDFKERSQLDAISASAYNK